MPSEAINEKAALKIDAGVLARLRAFHLAPGKQREALSYLWATAVPTAVGLTVLVPHNAPVFLMGDDCYERQSGGNVRLARLRHMFPKARVRGFDQSLLWAWNRGPVCASQPDSGSRGQRSGSVCGYPTAAGPWKLSWTKPHARQSAGYVAGRDEITAPSVYALNLRASGLLVTELLNYACQRRPTAVATSENWRTGKFQRYDRRNFRSRLILTARCATTTPGSAQPRNCPGQVVRPSAGGSESLIGALFDARRSANRCTEAECDQWVAMIVMIQLHASSLALFLGHELGPRGR